MLKTPVWCKVSSFSKTYFFSYSEYGFAEKVVEGMFIVVNSITIKIHSRAFHASFELWQLQGYSVNPNWQQSDLRFTRITDSHRGEVRP